MFQHTAMTGSWHSYESITAWNNNPFLKSSSRISNPFKPTKYFSSRKQEDPSSDSQLPPQADKLGCYPVQVTRTQVSAVQRARSTNLSEHTGQQRSIPPQPALETILISAVGSGRVVGERATTRWATSQKGLWKALENTARTGSYQKCCFYMSKGCQRQYQQPG